MIKQPSVYILASERNGTLYIGVTEWKRAWKLRLVESFNPSWQDLYDTIV
jgi:predicted GIY-YIG superfamily endonuclease